jgi:hypothetical protein
MNHQSIIGKIRFDSFDFKRLMVRDVRMTEAWFLVLEMAVTATYCPRRHFAIAIAVAFIHPSSGRQTMVRYAKKSDLSCSPFTIIGAGLVLAQFLIFNVGINFFHNKYLLQPESTQLGKPPPIHEFQQGRRSKAAKRKPRHQITVDPNADGTFNGYSIYYKEKKGAHTLPHCVGENYVEEVAWKHRSCNFNFFCFDVTKKDFVVFQSPEEEELYSHLEKRPFIDVSQSYLKQSKNHSNTVSLGGINLKWGYKKEGIPRLEWFPEIRTIDRETVTSYYELAPNVTMVPFHSMNAANPGHLVWDDFLPIYTLLTMFQLESQSELLMMRYVLKGQERGLWASCDWRDDKRDDCATMHKKFLPLMMGTNPVHDLTTTEAFNFAPKETGKSNLICARNGLAGIGSLTDHGTNKMHGWEENDYAVTHNHGRGGMLYEFRNYMVNNLGLPLEYNHKPPFRIVFSEKSSTIQTRHIDFTTQIDLLRKSFSPQYVSVESYVLKDLSLEKQVEIAGQTSIFISGCGGGAVTATFLPKGASVILYYLENGGVKDNKNTGKPARLDWDLFNNFGYLKVHWLPKRTMQNEVDLRSLASLVQHELDALMRERSYDQLFS